MYNANKEYYKYNLLGLSLVFESHVPENIVDWMNNALVQKEHHF